MGRPTVSGTTIPAAAAARQSSSSQENGGAHGTRPSSARCHRGGACLVPSRCPLPLPLLLLSAALLLGLPSLAQCQMPPVLMVASYADFPNGGPLLSALYEPSAVNRQRRLFRIADLVQASPQFDGGRQSLVRSSGAKRQLKDSTSSLSAFSKMDALKNNMMRALITLRRYRRGGEAEEGSRWRQMSAEEEEEEMKK